MAEGDPGRSESSLMLEYLRSRNAACPACGYDLRGMVTTNCPECGTALELGVQRADLRHPALIRAEVLLFWGCLAGMACLAAHAWMSWRMADAVWQGQSPPTGRTGLFWWMLTNVDDWQTDLEMGWAIVLLLFCPLALLRERKPTTVARADRARRRRQFIALVALFGTLIVETIVQV